MTVTASSSSSTRRLVVVAPWVYHPGCGIGGGVLCFNVLRELAQHFEIHFLSLDRTSHDLEGGHAALASLCASTTFFPAPAPRRMAVHLWRWLAAGEPMPAQQAWSEAMAGQLAQQVDALGPCTVLLQFPEMAQYAARLPSHARVVIDTQDIASVSRFREWRHGRGFSARSRKGLTWLAWARFELRHYARADHLVAISDTDLGVLRAFLPAVHSALSPVAVDLPPLLRRPEAGRVCFVGNFHHAPNADALAWMLAEVWPAVRAQLPSASLHLAGPACPPASPALEGLGVVPHGFVPDLHAFFAQSAVAVAPNRFGGGVKIKSLEAMAHACPLLATAIGAEGLGAADGIQLRVADDPRAFAVHLVGLLCNPDAAERMGLAGRAHVERHFSWAAKTAALCQVLQPAPPAS